MGIPLSIVIAVLRFHLYDLDLIIRRTLLYAVLTGLLVGIFALSVFVIQRVIGGFVGEDSPLGVAASTLLIAALFNPLPASPRADRSAVVPEQVRRPKGHRRFRRHCAERGGHEPALLRSARCRWTGRSGPRSKGCGSRERRARRPDREPIDCQRVSDIRLKKRRARSVVGLTRT
jgi:hypothetical protein